MLAGPHIAATPKVHRRFTPWSPEVDLPSIASEQLFNIGRPPILERGDEQTIAMAFDFPNHPLRSTGPCELEVTIDDSVMRRMPFRRAIAPSTARSHGAKH
jgi:hypothetical protein